MEHSKKTMSDNDAQALISYIRRRCSGVNGHYDYFCRPDTVCELVEATLIGLGYDSSWVTGPLSRQLRTAVEQHRDAM